MHSSHATPLLHHDQINCLRRVLCPWPVSNNVTWHCDKKESIKSTWVQSVIMMPHLLAAGSWIYHVTIVLIVEWYRHSGAVSVDLRQLSEGNHINDCYTEYMELEMFGVCYERSVRHLGFSGDKIYKMYLHNCQTSYWIQMQQNHVKISFTYIPLNLARSQSIKNNQN